METGERANFADKLAALVSCSAKEGDAEHMGMMIERLAAALGFTIALASRGDAETIDRMIAGAESYAHAEAVHKAPFARFIGEIKASKR